MPRPNEYYRVNTGVEQDFYAVVVHRDDGMMDVVCNQGGKWHLDRSLLADIDMPEQKHMDWVVDKISKAEVPKGWEKLASAA